MGNGLQDDGWEVVDLLTPNECDLLVQYLAAIRTRPRDLGSGDPLRIHTMESMAHRFLGSYLADERLVAPMMRILGPDVRVFWEQVITRRPGSTGTLPWHQDAGYSTTFGDQMVAVWLALTPADATNGGIKLLPGSHRQGILRHQKVPPQLRAVHPDDLPDTSQAVSVPLRQGQGIVFTPYTVHASFANTSTRNRMGWIIHYAAAAAVHGATGKTLDNRPWVARRGRVLGEFEFDEDWTWSQPVENGWVDLDDRGNVVTQPADDARAGVR